MNNGDESALHQAALDNTNDLLDKIRKYKRKHNLSYPALSEEVEIDQSRLQALMSASKKNSNLWYFEAQLILMAIGPELNDD